MRIKYRRAVGKRLAETEGNFMRAIGALTAALPTLTIVAALSAPSPFKCGNMAVDGYRYDLSALDK